MTARPSPKPRRARCSRACSRDDLPRHAARWRVGGEIDRPRRRSPVPLLNIVSTTDRIVPAATAPRAGERLDLALGHVGMVVGSRAPQMLWEPLAGLAFPHCSKLLEAPPTPIIRRLEHP